jgi:hypothetical protein
MQCQQAQNSLIQHSISAIDPQASISAPCQAQCHLSPGTNNQTEETLITEGTLYKQTFHNPNKHSKLQAARDPRVLALGGSNALVLHLYQPLEYRWSASVRA